MPFTKAKIPETYMDKNKPPFEVYLDESVTWAHLLAVRKKADTNKSCTHSLTVLL